MHIETKIVVEKVELTEEERQAVNIVLKILDEIDEETSKYSGDCDCCPIKKLCDDMLINECLLTTYKKGLQKLL